MRRAADGDALLSPPATLPPLPLPGDPTEAVPRKVSSGRSATEGAAAPRAGDAAVLLPIVVAAVAPVAGAVTRMAEGSSGAVEVVTGNLTHRLPRLSDCTARPSENAVLLHSCPLATAGALCTLLSALAFEVARRHAKQAH